MKAIVTITARADTPEALAKLVRDAGVQAAQRIKPMQDAQRVSMSLRTDAKDSHTCVGLFSDE